MSLHYKFGGSTAGRTIQCPAWTNLSKNMPSGPASLAALTGTLGHLLFERGIEDEEFEPALMVGESRIIDGTTLVVDEVIVDKVYTALEVMDAVAQKWNLKYVLPEVIMSTDDDTGGTADIIGYDSRTEPVKVFAVGDLKTGDGHMVYAKDNEQLLFYAWQAVERFKGELTFDDETVVLLFIIQPSDRRDDPLDEWTCSIRDVLAYGELFKQKQKEAKAGQTKPCPGKHCSYCPAMSTCPAKTGMVAESLRIPAKSRELDDLIKALAVVDEAEEWCRSVRKMGHEQAEAGVELPGFKLVQKRAIRKWKDDNSAMAPFKNSPKFKIEDYMDMKPKSPAQMEKVCKAKSVDFKRYESSIEAVSSGTTLVKATDKRTAVLPLKALGALAARIKK